ncbi:hypothetical protein [Paenibacillus typhae]|uniref:hypothetical protein n=1 Tax=Paenibacillus typhae TaxID=1174501 RepID=UPI001C8E977F|nr:hypothetical protein [Paenibacillus typhae]MBY0010874.1 hypothetical protein [Paenibacillus typhae]
MRVAGSSSRPFTPRRVPSRVRTSGLQRKYRRRRDARESEIVLILVLFMLLIVVLLFFS